MKTNGTNGLGGEDINPTINLLQTKVIIGMDMDMDVDMDTGMSILKCSII